MNQLISRKIFFDNVEGASADISNNGQWLIWVAPFKGVRNLWIAALDNLSDATPLTTMTDRPIEGGTWTADDSHVIFRKDTNGDENYHLFAVDVRTRKIRGLTPAGRYLARLEPPSHEVPGKVVITTNERDESWFDAYIVDVRTGERQLVWENVQELSSFHFDRQLRLRVVTTETESGGAVFWRVEEDRLIPWFETDFVDNLSTFPIAFDASGETLLMRDSVGFDADAYVLRYLNSHERVTVAVHDRCDVENVFLDPIDHRVLAASAVHTREDWFYTHESVQKDFDLIKDALPDFDFLIGSVNRDLAFWIVNATKPEQPWTTFLYDRAAGEVRELFRSRPKLAEYALAPMRPVLITSRDGLELVSYLTLPVDHEGREGSKPIPMVVCVHGGPSARDYYGYVPEHQWFANRGYAVLSVNYRGSKGFGKSFSVAGDREHARKVHNDILDAVAWAISEQIADPAKIAIYGASYGGYEAFVAATFTPDVFCCSVPVVGFTNLQTLLETIPPRWKPMVDSMYRQFGDPRTEEGRTLLADRSPLYRADQISRPLLILHGQNDVRCKIAESEAIVEAIKDKGKPVTFVVFPDEGHCLASPGNELAHAALVEAFLAQHLGGRFEPFGTDLDASSYEIRWGENFIDALHRHGGH